MSGDTSVWISWSYTSLFFYLNYHPRYTLAGFDLRPIAPVSSVVPLNHSARTTLHCFCTQTLIQHTNERCQLTDISKLLAPAYQACSRSHNFSTVPERHTYCQAAGASALLFNSFSLSLSFVVLSLSLRMSVGNSLSLSHTHTLSVGCSHLRTLAIISPRKVIHAPQASRRQGILPDSVSCQRQSLRTSA
jgi:hypothetical protein